MAHVVKRAVIGMFAHHSIRILFALENRKIMNPFAFLTLAVFLLGELAILSVFAFNFFPHSYPWL